MPLLHCAVPCCAVQGEERKGSQDVFQDDQINRCGWGWGGANVGRISVGVADVGGANVGGEQSCWQSWQLVAERIAVESGMNESA